MMADVYEELMAHARETAALEQVAGRLSWDQETMMPRGAAEQRGEEMAAMEGVIHLGNAERIRAPLIIEAANDNGAMRNMVENIARENLNPVDQWRGVERLVALGWTEDAIALALALPVRQIKKLRLLANLFPGMLEQIALGVNSSRAQLYRLFQAQPLSVHGTLREARLLKSVEYLRHCGDKLLSIGAIAYACGFSDQSVFSKLFRQRFGLTPSEVRNGQGDGAVNLA